MYSRIFVPMDESPISQAALEEAIRLGRDQHATLRLLHVLDVGQVLWGAVEMVDMVGLQRSLIAGAKAWLAKAVAKAEAAGLKTESHLCDTPGERVPRLIVEDATAWNAEIIVMGTHGKRGFDHLLLGSIAEGVMRIATVPLLLIRTPV